jgi:hypothetical protein
VGAIALKGRSGVGDTPTNPKTHDSLNTVNEVYPGGLEVDMANKNQITLTVVVNGRPTEVTDNVKAPLKTLIPKALEQTDNQGRPLTDWELRDAAGVELPLEQTIEAFNFPSGTKLFLNLKAGVGGAVGVAG